MKLKQETSVGFFLRVFSKIPLFAKMHFTIFLCCGFIRLVSCQSTGQYVNHFIGTQGTAPETSYNGGNVFPGATLPFGAVKVGIDTTEYARNWYLFNGLNQ